MSTTQGMDKLRDAGGDLLRNLGDRALDFANDTLSGLTDKLGDVGSSDGAVGKAVGGAGEAVAQGDNPIWGGVKGAASGIKDKLTGGGGGGGGGKATDSTNLIETIDVGVPISVAYNQWTEFGAFPSFMKKVESVEAQEDTKLKFKAQIALSHRTWEATIKSQIPDERIVWQSSGEKGHVDGAITFHEIAPNLTRILMVLEYYPQGLFEKTGNIWRAQGRRARAELRHFRRHVMTRTILDPEGVEGWRGRIEDSEVVETHEDAVEREEQEAREQGVEGDYDDAPEGDYDDVPEDEYDDVPEDEYDDVPEDEQEPADGEDEGVVDEVPAEEYEDEVPEDEVPEDEVPEDEVPEDEVPEDEVPEDEDVDDVEEEYDEEVPDEEEQPRPRRRRKSS